MSIFETFKYQMPLNTNFIKKLELNQG